MDFYFENQSLLLEGSRRAAHEFDLNSRSKEDEILSSSFQFPVSSFLYTEKLSKMSKRTADTEEAKVEGVEEVASPVKKGRQFIT